MKTPTLWRPSNAPQTQTTTYSSSTVTYNSPVTAYAFLITGINTIGATPTSWTRTIKTPTIWSGTPNKMPANWTKSAKTPTKWIDTPNKTPTKWIEN